MVTTCPFRSFSLLLISLKYSRYPAAFQIFRAFCIPVKYTGFIENSGTKPLRAILGKNKRPLFVQPGSCAAVKISFEPVYSVING